MSQKYSTTSSTITWTRIVWLQNFWYAHCSDYRSSKDGFILPPHQFNATVLPWDTFKPRKSRM